MRQWATGQQIQYDNVAELFQNPLLKIRLRKHIQELNSKLASFEVIKKFEVVSDSWTVENGSLTPSLKVKRKFLEIRYVDILNEIYE